MNPLAGFFASNVDNTGALASSKSRADDEKSTSRSNHARPGPTQQHGQRVCDSKKVKCDMKQPTCSRCLEAESPCVYSVKKRKPGPVKGSKHARRRTSKDTANTRSSISENSSSGSRKSPDISTSQAVPWQATSSIRQDLLPPPSMPMPMPDIPVTALFSQSASPIGIPPSIPSPLGIPPSEGQQRLLLDNFFLRIHPSIPLFHQERLIARYETRTISPHLLMTICVVTAKVLGMGDSWNGPSLEDCTAYLLDLKVIGNERAGKTPSLDKFRQACLVAFYAFHQYPGDKSWMRIGNLTRTAYQCGLHQIDYQSAGSQFDRDMVSPEDLEEWRYVWWCIYCLDCYSNVTAVTPFIVEVESIKTALVSSSLTARGSELPFAAPLKYLPDDTSMLWKTAKEVTTSSGEINFDMHILTTTLIREAATMHRLRKQSFSKRVHARLADLDDYFSAFRLALLARYFNASRNTFINESSSEHHARLVCVLHICLARIMTYFPYNPQDNIEDWLTWWQQCLEFTGDITAIVKQWDGQRFTSTDPAICFIVSFALTLIRIHSCAADASAEFKVRLETYKEELVLFLEQFATAWSLPRFLIISFEQFKKLVSGPLTPTDIDRLLKVSVGPINYRWLNSLSLSAYFDALESPGRLYENLFAQEWDSNDWEAVVPLIQS